MRAKRHAPRQKCLFETLIRKRQAQIVMTRFSTAVRGSFCVPSSEQGGDRANAQRLNPESVSSHIEISMQRGAPHAVGYRVRSDFKRVQSRPWRRGKSPLISAYVRGVICITARLGSPCSRRCEPHHPVSDTGAVRVRVKFLQDPRAVTTSICRGG